MHSRDPITSFTNDPVPPPSIHSTIRKENLFSKGNGMKFRFDPGLSRYRCFVGNNSVKRRYIYMCVCVILDTFRWYFNFHINVCLNRIYHDLANLYFTDSRDREFYSFDVCLFPI